jgi:hypothetical protein
MICAIDMPARLALLWVLLSSPQAVAQNAYGSFPDPLDLRLSSNGRDAKLLAPFAYIDADGKRWEVPAGTTVDGASIPWPLWSIIGSPWTGRYREASVVHDYYCETKKAPWKVVHRRFYTAMLANGVDEIQAKIMYAAVYRFGPRWDFEYTLTCPNCAAVPLRVDSFMPAFKEEEFEVLQQQAKEGAPIETLETEAEALFQKNIKNIEVGTPVFVR